MKKIAFISSYFLDWSSFSMEASSSQKKETAETHKLFLPITAEALKEIDAWGVPVKINFENCCEDVEASDLKEISELKNLGSLDLTGCRFLRGIKIDEGKEEPQWEKLIYLNSEHCASLEGSIFRNAKKLWVLDLGFNLHRMNIDVIANSFPELRSLTLSWCHYENLTDLGKLTHLRHLKIGDSKCDEQDCWSFLRKLEKLVLLELPWCNNTNLAIRCLSDLPKERKFYLNLYRSTGVDDSLVDQFLKEHPNAVRINSIEEYEKIISEIENEYTIEMLEIMVENKAL